VGMKAESCHAFDKSTAGKSTSQATTAYEINNLFHYLTDLIKKIKVSNN